MTPHKPVRLTLEEMLLLRNIVEEVELNPEEQEALAKLKTIITIREQAKLTRDKVATTQDFYSQLIQEFPEKKEAILSFQDKVRLWPNQLEFVRNLL